MKLKDLFFKKAPEQQPPVRQISAPPTPMPNVLGLVDYENIAIEAVELGKVVDFERLANGFRDLGNVVAMVIFASGSWLGNDYTGWVESSRRQGFFHVPTRSKYDVGDDHPAKQEDTPVKQKDTADTAMMAFGRGLLPVVDMVAIVTNDSDFITFVNDLKNVHKGIRLFHGENVSRVLKNAVPLRYPVPLRNR